MFLSFTLFVPCRKERSGDFHPAVCLKKVTGGTTYHENRHVGRQVPPLPTSIFWLQAWHITLRGVHRENWQPMCWPTSLALNLKVITLSVAKILHFPHINKQKNEKSISKRLEGLFISRPYNLIARAGKCPLETFWSSTETISENLTLWVFHLSLALWLTKLVV